MTEPTQSTPSPRVSVVRATDPAGDAHWTLALDGRQAAYTYARDQAEVMREIARLANDPTTALPPEDEIERLRAFVSWLNGTCVDNPFAIASLDIRHAIERLYADLRADPGPFRCTWCGTIWDTPGECCEHPTVSTRED